MEEIPKRYLDLFQNVLDIIAHDTGKVYQLKIKEPFTKKETKIGNLESKKVLVEDYGKLNGIYSSVQELEESAYHINGHDYQLKKGEISCNGGGFCQYDCDHKVAGHYKYIV